MIAQSQSGTGKTASFALAMLSRAVPSNHFPQCICLAPTYELAVQIGEVVRKMAQFLPEVKVHYAVKNNGGSFEKINQHLFHFPFQWNLIHLQSIAF